MFQASLTDETKRAVYDRFTTSSSLHCLVGTIAFGMVSMSLVNCKIIVCVRREWTFETVWWWCMEFLTQLLVTIIMIHLEYNHCMRTYGEGGGYEVIVILSMFSIIFLHMQLSGRAGRNGHPAQCMLFTNSSELKSCKVNNMVNFYLDKTRCMKKLLLESVGDSLYSLQHVLRHMYPL